jgi:hypothetical protein
MLSTMTTHKTIKNEIRVGYQVYLEDGGDEVGAVRDLCGHRPEIVVYVENARDFNVPLEAIKAVHFEKVVLDQKRLPEDMRLALRRAHETETE